MPKALKKQHVPEVLPAEELDEDFGSPEDMAALMVEAFTMPMASDLADTQDEDTTKATPHTPKSRN
ncbi:hypothetical protein SAMN03159496_03437 [Rhizobium sp. NFR07]|uniref:hypothetical protein n=1 Tax=Rhizobium sp. NFR07 TaxID=1566262 RepID=UPI0008EE5014|nr:hypothetical protein [Rhizobium sp. NFR07]SFB39740.1 hypothetical protein SAMN03159496_03437 [Rhizobium sp. NFR07]